MTDIKIVYNPIESRTDILVNGKDIAVTSRLYKYRNTCLEYYIDIIIPEMVSYCNDDINLEVFSIKKYIENMQKKVKEYLRENPDIDIRFTGKECLGYRERLAKLENIQSNLVGIVSSDNLIYNLPIFIISLRLVQRQNLQLVE